MKTWCCSLCERFQYSAGAAWSHSQVEEWMAGSRIQSHWPWRTLWPISMLSRILASARPVVPMTQAGRFLREQQHRPAAELEGALHPDDPSDVRRVPGAAGVEDVLSDLVELLAEQLDVVGREVGDRAQLLVLHGGHRSFVPFLSDMTRIAAAQASGRAVW